MLCDTGQLMLSLDYQLVLNYSFGCIFCAVFIHSLNSRMLCCALLFVHTRMYSRAGWAACACTVPTERRAECNANKLAHLISPLNTWFHGSTSFQWGRLKNSCHGNVLDDPEQHWVYKNEPKISLIISQKWMILQYWSVWVVLDTSWPGYELTWVRVDLGTSWPGYELTWVRVDQGTNWPGCESTGVRVDLGKSWPGYELTWMRVNRATSWPGYELTWVFWIWVDPIRLNLKPW